MYTPDNETFTELFLSAFRAAAIAGNRILEIYKSNDFHVSMKSDNSPLSSADKEAHDIIKKQLIHSRIPILSEEGRDMQFEERKSWDILWIVDPLDGTRQFIQRREEFTVNIALVTGGSPLFGVIYAPAIGEIYFGIKEIGSFKINIKEQNPDLLNMSFQEIMDISKKLPSSMMKNDTYTVLASYNHVNKETLEYIDEVRKEYRDVEVKKVGSSLKMCMLADGIGDVYIRYTDTYEWDTAAAQTILEGVGWSINSLDTNEPLTYNKESLLNPYFICKKSDSILN
ncbi:MAG: 3'(2'),5'-bisphosphate nucleotidase CysQ [Prevotellaceae bacterium]|jgi:3'(2'), 5'-bisphosphate nucleotidase|nr:3'(2'),5'-bisphosphate nucleotidase CysQ [Prevotellaceae bacterium]